nr:hypothetical protein [Tanacetum cinerariifolium]
MCMSYTDVAQVANAARNYEILHERDDQDSERPDKREFEALMHEKFQMSAMGELNFFLGLQVLQKEDGIFISQDKGATILVSEPGYETVGSKDLTCEDWMVNTRTDADLSAAVQNALQTLLPQIREEIREEFRTGSGSSNDGGNTLPVTIHTWLECFNKQKPHSFKKATAPVDAENWISHMEKIFDVMGCEDAFKTRLAVYNLRVMHWLGGKPTSKPRVVMPGWSRVVTGATVKITTVMDLTGEVVVTTTAAATTTNLAVTTGIPTPRRVSSSYRLRLQDIEDMLLLLVQGKLSNLTVEEHFAFNKSLRMFTRSIVIQRSVEDLQLGVESYQKRLILTKPDTYRSDLKRREAYTAYSNPRGFIYQNMDKKNRLMQIDELNKFNDGTLNEVRNALDDRLKGIKMQYLPQTLWRKTYNGLLEDDCMRETSGCCKGPYDSSYASPIFTEETLKRRWRYLVPAESHIHNHMLILDYQDNKYQDFRYSDELSKSRKMEILLESTSNKFMVVTHWFTHIMLSALRRSDNENTLSLKNLILRSILIDLQETLKRRWRYLVLAESHIHNHMLIPDYQENKYQDFRYSDELSKSRKEPDNSLSIADEHLDTIPAMESDEFVKSSVKNLVPNPRESEGEYECDVPACEVFTTFSNILFDADYDFYSSDDQSFYDEDIPKEIYSNPLFDKEIISMKIDPHQFNVESDLIESLFNHDSLIISSYSKIDSLFDEFAGELTLLKSIPPGINETDCDHEKETCLIKILFDSFMEEIDLSFTLDDPMPSGIEEDNYDFERDILILEEFLSNDSLSLLKNELFHFDSTSSSRPPAKPPDGNSGILNVKVMGDILMPRLMITQPTLVLN